MLDTPVALFLFNRPELTCRVFERIREARPRRLLLIADGPRHDADRPRCAAAREVVAQIDWPCDVERHFSEQNLGCRVRMSSGLDWVFRRTERAILLEDDCLPDGSFFPYCQELLDRYADDPRIGMISGDNFQGGGRRTPFSYYFSNIPHIWGWATWRRVWKHYDVAMSRWPALRETDWLNSLFPHPKIAAAYRHTFDQTHAGRIDTWDHQFAFMLWSRRQLSILPETNLIQNIGFAPDATHTRNPASPDAALPTEPLNFPLRHPPGVQVCEEADRFTWERAFSIAPQTNSANLNPAA